MLAELQLVEQEQVLVVAVAEQVLHLLALQHQQTMAAMVAQVVAVVVALPH
jgi:hypothetical protein